MRSLANRATRPQRAFAQILDDSVRDDSRCPDCTKPKRCMTDGRVTDNEMNDRYIRKMLGLCLCEVEDG